MAIFKMNGALRGYVLASTAGAWLMAGCVGFSEDRQGAGESQQAAGGNPSANLDQCGNGPLSAPVPCTGTAWVNGNLNSSKSHYVEGDSIPYRMKFDNMSLGSHTVTIEWDTTKASKHAIDYVTDWNASVHNANPCLGVSGCVLATHDDFAIPADPQVTGAGVTPLSGSFSMWGGDITAASAYSYSNGSGFSGDKSASITLTFTSGAVEGGITA